MTRDQIISEAASCILTEASNRLDLEGAYQHGLSGAKIFDEPLVGFSSADDPLFTRMKEKEVVGPQFMSPTQWLPEAKSVISIFLPFTEAIRKSNYLNNAMPSSAWLYGRIEGQQFVKQVIKHIADTLKAQGYLALVPGQDERFKSVRVAPPGTGGVWSDAFFTSNWSERHAAYVCGLGTFGLSKGLITEKGMAGRLCSVVTSAAFPPTQRPYTQVYEYCIMCGACIKRCPAEAITLEQGKDQQKCASMIDRVKKLCAPRYGCGKCQVRVPCESSIPKKRI